MIDNFLKGALGLGVLCLVAGIVAAPLTGSDRAFEFAPVLSTARGVWNWISTAGQKSQQVEADPKPFAEESKAAIERLGQATDKALQQSKIAPDPRLSVCPVGSIEQQNVKELPLTTVAAFKAQTDKGLKLTFVDVQAALGQPACNIRSGSKTQWRYLAPEGRIVDAVQEAADKPVVVRFTNF